MFKRVLFIILALAILVGMGLCTTAAIADQQKKMGKFTHINQVGEIYFSAISEGWLDAGARYEAIMAEAIKEAKSNPLRLPVSEVGIRELAKTHPRSKFDYALAKETNYTIYRLGITMPDDAKLVFHGVGCLNFELKMPDGRVVTVMDQGVFCPYQYPKVQTWEDTRRTNLVTFTTKFDEGKLGAYPNFVYVLLPKWTMGAVVQQVQPSEKLDILSPNRTAAFK